MTFFMFLAVWISLYYQLNNILIALTGEIKVTKIKRPTSLAERTQKIETLSEPIYPFTKALAE